tara:strand:+ start:4602 stop:4733 length:132 start_codon:yes stop_codon:yes gene_type:complete
MLIKESTTATITSAVGLACGYPKFQAITITNHIIKIFIKMLIP